MRRQSSIAVLGSVLAFLSLEAFATPTPRQLQEADRYCQFGNQALKTGNAGKAKGLFQKALRFMPSFPDAHMGLGHIAMSERRFEGALEQYGIARDSYIALADSLFELQVLHYARAQDEIGKLRGEILNYHRQLASRMTQQASFLERRITELEAAIQQLERTKHPTPGAAEPPGEVYFYIGNALFNLNRLDDAVGAWETCTRKSPRFALVHNNLAVAYWKKGRVEAALGSLTRAEALGFQINPNFRTDLEKSIRQGVEPSIAGNR